MLSKTIDYWLFRCYRTILSNSSSNQATILMFHRVHSGAKTGFDDNIGADEFRLKIKLLKKYFNIISLPTLIEQMKTNEVPPLSVVITIDDGYEDGYSIITPILDEFGIKGAFFIASEGVEKGGLWNDRILQAVMKTDINEISLFEDTPSLNLSTLQQKQSSWRIIHNKCKFLTLAERENIIGELEAKLLLDLNMNKFLSKKQLCEMHNAGMIIGAHTHKHPILTVEADQTAFDEIKKSKIILEEIIDSEVKYFAYPNGKYQRDYEDKHLAMVKELGFEAALTTDVGTVSHHSNLLSLPRFTPWDKEPTSFALRLCHHLYKSK